MILKPDPQDKVFKKSRFHPCSVYLIPLLSLEAIYIWVYAHTQQRVCVYL